MATYPFSGASAEVRDYGQRSKFRHGGTWAVGDTWTAAITSTLSGNFTFGKGNISDKTITSVFKFRNRAILGFAGGFALSAIDDPTGWEEQNVGSAVIPFTTQYGLPDSAYGYVTVGSRFAVFGERTVQLWTIDADPSKWVLSQVLDNTGTKHGEGIQAIGEVDALFPDKTGVRSLKSKELSGDAFVSDVGTPVDSLVRAKLRLAESNSYKVCSIIDPTTKNYWVFIYDKIFVLSQSPMSKISAWSTFDCTIPTTEIFPGSVAYPTSYTGLTIGVRYFWRPADAAISLTNGSQVLTKSGSFVATATTATLLGTPGGDTTQEYLQRIDESFRPVKFLVDGNRIYIVSSANKLYFYDVESGAQDNSYAICETPWHQISTTSTFKQFEALDVAVKGSWKVSVATNPKTENFVEVTQTLVTGTPTILNSSTFDIRRYACSGNGTHVKLRFETSDDTSNDIKLAAASVVYNTANQK